MQKKHIRLMLKNIKDRQKHLEKQRLDLIADTEELLQESYTSAQIEQVSEVLRELKNEPKEEKPTKELIVVEEPIVNKPKRSRRSRGRSNAKKEKVR